MLRSSICLFRLVRDKNSLIILCRCSNHCNIYQLQVRELRKRKHPQYHQRKEGQFSAVGIGLHGMRSDTSSGCHFGLSRPSTSLSLCFQRKGLEAPLEQLSTTWHVLFLNVQVKKSQWSLENTEEHQQRFGLLRLNRQALGSVVT